MWVFKVERGLSVNSRILRVFVLGSLGVLKGRKAVSN